MDAMQRKADFGKWLLDLDGGNITHGTKNCYLSAINRFQKEFLGGKNFYTCDIAMIDAFKEEDGQGFAVLDGKVGGALNAAINKYRAFLKSAPAFAPVILHKAPQNIDITQVVTEALLVNLFIKTYKVNFPGYEIYKGAQGKSCKDFSLLLENSAEKKALFVVLVPHSTDGCPKLLQNIMSDFDTLDGLFKKSGEELSVLVVAGSFEQGFKNACNVIPSVRLARYSLGALELQDA